MTNPSSLSATVTDTGQAEVKKAARLFYVDHLRAALVILVVVHHVALVYGASVQGFYYLEPPVNPLSFVALLIFVLFNQAWFMGALFLLAGYCTPGSYERKGPATYTMDRLVRLGIPALVWVFVLNPLSRMGWWLMPAALTGITDPPSWQAYGALLGLGPLWFVVVLLIFSVGYVVWRSIRGDAKRASIENAKTPGYLGLIVFVVALAVASYLIRIVIPIGQSVSEFPTFAYLPQYVSFFVIGIVAYRRDWLNRIPGAMGLVGLVAAVLASIILFPLAFSGRLFSLELTETMNSAMGGGTWRSAVYAIWDSIFAVGISLATITHFRRSHSTQGKLGRFLSRQSFGVYLIHIPLIVFLAYLLRGIRLGGVAKTLLTTLIAVPLCFLVAYVIRQLGRLRHNAKQIEPGATDDPAAAGPGEGPSSSSEEITVSGLSKTFGDITAVNNVSFEIRPGELFGLLGPNGAGKTTTIRMLCGLLEPTAGTAQISGFDIKKNPALAKASIGVCPQESAAYKFLSGMENIELLGNLHGMDRHVLKERAQALVGQSDFGEAAKRKVKGYSGGMLRQLNLLMALINDPGILFLDEPTVGMDARARRRTWEYISMLKEQGKTIILTTHYIEEAQALSDRVGVIDYGELIAVGTPEELMAEHEAEDLEGVFLTITGRRIAEGS